MNHNSDQYFVNPSPGAAITRIDSMSLYKTLIGFVPLFSFFERFKVCDKLVLQDELHPRKRVFNSLYLMWRSDDRGGHLRKSIFSGSKQSMIIFENLVLVLDRLI